MLAGITAFVCSDRLDFELLSLLHVDRASVVIHAKNVAVQETQWGEGQ
jgi:hypothetical protein